MHTEQALQKLGELREITDGDINEMVDALARIVMLQQDIRNPMLGAKVTVYLRPPTVQKMMPVSEMDDPERRDWQYPFRTDDWDDWEMEWVNGEPDEEPDEVTKVREKVNPDDPDVVAHKAIVIEGNITDNAPDGQLWDPNKGEYMTRDEYPLGTVNVVIAYDKYEDELIDFEHDYPTDVKPYTSIVPAGDEPSAHEYTPGWPDE